MSDSVFEVRISWQRHLGRMPVADRWFESVVGRYHEQHRRYHDVRHLRWVVRHVERLAGTHRTADLSAVVAAAFFHDCIYDATASDNEAASARLAASALGELEWGSERIEQVTSMIEGTARHEHIGADGDHQLLYAADLAVLAASPAGYSDYVRNVRHEYDHVVDADWIIGRAAVLQGFLSRDAIYAPALDLGAWEQRARGNMTAELDGLRNASA